MPEAIPVITPAVFGGPILSGASSPAKAVVANYEGHAVDEVEKAVENIDVAGYRLLVVLPKIAEKTKGGIFVDPVLADKEKLAACIGYVAKAGPDAYGDKKRFPNGPYCQEGDWVVFRSYSGTRIQSTVNGIELRIMNDDSIEAVIKDVTKYTRV